MEADGSKIPDLELRHFAMAEETDEQRSIIIELEVGPPRLAPRETVPRPRSPGQDLLSTLDLAGAEEEGWTMRQLENELTALGLAKNMVRLDTAQAFVVTVRPEQLRAIVRLPLVSVVRPNRTHRVPSS